jgi:CheY-like chemotaxis protein
MGGQIEVEKSSAEGTDFLISFEAQVENASPWFRPSDSLDASLSREVVLALSIDSTRSLLESYLAGLHWKVRKADSFPALTRRLEEVSAKAVLIIDRDLLPARGQQELPEFSQAVREKSLRVIVLADRPQDLAPGLRNSLDGCLPRFLRLPSLFAILNKPLDLSMPLEAPRSAISAVSRSPSAGPDQSNRLANLRILVAEDNPNNQKVLRLMLRKMGCHVQMVENGLQAVQAASKGEFDLIILDLQMPIMDGLTAVARLRDYFAWSNLPGPVIMALTANAFEEDRAACLAAGFDFYLAKPVSASQLRNAIEDCLARGVVGT